MNINIIRGIQESRSLVGYFWAGSKNGKFGFFDAAFLLYFPKQCLISIFVKFHMAADWRPDTELNMMHQEHLIFMDDKCSYGKINFFMNMFHEDGAGGVSCWPVSQGCVIAFVSLRCQFWIYRSESDIFSILHAWERNTRDTLVCLLNCYFKRIPNGCYPQHSAACSMKPAPYSFCASMKHGYARNPLCVCYAFYGNIIFVCVWIANGRKNDTCGIGIAPGNGRVL